MPHTHPLLDRLIDYAGLFPPAALPMEAAVREYAQQRTAPQAWMLAAFVVPAARLPEFAAAVDQVLGSEGPGWPLSVLLGPDPMADLERLGAWSRSHSLVGHAVAVELRPSSASMLREVAAAAPTGAQVYCELPWDEDPAPWMPVLRELGAFAKIRTGGVTAELVPPVVAVARFLDACVRAEVGLKFTAGLHHPIRAPYALTYEEDAPVAVMHGFLNVFVATILLSSGAIDAAQAIEVLEETDPHEFSLSDDGGVRWRELSLTGDFVRGARTRTARSFGSCSFAEPVQDLAALGMS